MASREPLVQQALRLQQEAGPEVPADAVAAVLSP
jgi:hypothetical protein